MTRGFGRLKTCNGIQKRDTTGGCNWRFSWDMWDDTLVTWMICMKFLIHPLPKFFESPRIRESKEAIQFYKDVLQYTANVAT